MFLRALLLFLKKPEYSVDDNRGLKYRGIVFLKLLALSIVLSIGLGTLIGALESFTTLDLGEHAIDKMFQDYSSIFIFVAAVIAAPLLEEFMFRGPMIFFKNSQYFPYIFYGLTLAFGFYHLVNFEITTMVLVLAPLLVAPQICIGAILGFVRVRFGLGWAILLHSCYNLVLLGPLVLIKILDLYPE